MSEIYEGYERQYCELSDSLSRDGTSLAFLDGEQKKQKISKIKSDLDNADSLIRKMDLEIKSFQPSIKASLLAKLRGYKSDLSNLKTEIKRHTSATASQISRDELLESRMTDANMVSADQRERLLISTQKINKTSERIREGRRTMLETEDLGVSLLHNMHQQRESLLRANEALHGVDANVGRSRNIIITMTRRPDRNKWIIGLLITVLLIAIVVILYFKLWH